MDYGELPSGEREFVKTFHAGEGEYQYKFRLGPGDWWVCDEDKPTVDDGLGNRNNVLVVKDDVAPRKHAAEPQSSADNGVESHSPTLPREQNSSKGHSKRDSLGDDVVDVSEIHDKHEVPLLPHEENDHHGAPLLSHEKVGSPRGKLDVPPETVPVSFSRQDTLALDDDDPDVEPAESSGAPIFDRQRDVKPVPTPDVFDDEDDDHQPPLMSHEVLSPAPVKPVLRMDDDEDDAHQPPLLSHETLSPASAKHAQNPFEARNHGKHHHDYDSEAVSSPTSSHIPEEADPNDPSLEEFPTHHEGIMSSLRRSSMRMAEHETRPDIHDSTSPIAKTVSQASQSPSLPSVLEDEEDSEEDSVEPPQKNTNAHAPSSQVPSLATGLPALSGNHERPAALMTPPRTPDESKGPAGVHSSHHHSQVAEKDMREEASHDVKHHDSHHHHQKAAEKPAGLDGDSEPSGSTNAKSKEEPKLKKTEAGVADKNSRSGFFETALGLGLVVAVGVGAAWLAFMMQDPIKDGGAALTGAS